MSVIGDMFEEYIKKIVSQHMEENPMLIVEPTFVTKLLNHVKLTYPKNTAITEIIEYWYKNINDILRSLQIIRSDVTYEYCKLDEPRYESIITYLQGVHQPEQRTNEWYLYRYNHLTASNAWKTFGTQSSKNELIYEKCNPMNISKYGPSLSESPMTWGHKYEPLTAKIYEHLNKTQISDFGCIEHKDYPFLAASPDGIVTGDINYGRMIEIKNVVSREISGIPKKDYYIQMQLQMEVCDLDECDFVETKFTEYNFESDFIEDNKESNVLHPIKKGVICSFIKDGTSFHYEYMPFDYEGTYTEWLRQVIETTTANNRYVWFRNLFWKLEVYSCVLVKRQTVWFKHAVKELAEIWKIICEERLNGEYYKRSPKKRDASKLKVVKLNADEKDKNLNSLFDMADE